MDIQVSHRGGGQVQLQALPVIAIVKRNIHRIAGPRIQQPFADWIFANNVGSCALQKTGNYELPALPEVARSIDQRMQVHWLAHEGLRHTRLIAGNHPQYYPPTSRL